MQGYIAKGVIKGSIKELGPQEQSITAEAIVILFIL